MFNGMHGFRRMLVAASAGGVVLLSLFVGAPTAHGVTFTVTNTADSGPGSLRQAIFDANAAAGPDTVEVPAGTYDLLDYIGITDDITIVGAGADQTIISSNFTSQIFLALPGHDLTFEGVRLQEGVAPAGNNGGAIQAIGTGSLTIRDSAIIDSSADRGGAVTASGGAITIERTVFSGNASIAGNPVGGGGALLFSNATVSITDSTFDDNRALHPTVAANGGAISAFGGTLTVSTNPGSGAGIYVDGTTTTILNSTFSSNQAFGGGGGVAASAGSTVGITHSSFVFNVGYFDGGAGVFASDAQVQLTNTLLHQNLSTAADSNCAVVGTGAIISSGGNVSDDTTCVGLTQPTDLNNDNATTLALLADNGGLTRTHALLTGSSAVDVAPCPQGVVDDQRDVARPLGAACDSGAYELDPTAVPPTSEAVTTTTLVETTTTVVEPTTTVADTSTTISETTTTAAGTGTTQPGLTTTTIDLGGGALPETGTTSWALLAIAAALVGGGALSLVGARRR